MNKWFIGISAALIITGGGVVVYNQVRGIRNNNPGNIRHGDNWQGMSESQTDSAFVQFDDPVYGIRALNKVLKSYATRHGLNTVYSIIDRWAPSNENNTLAYVEHVANMLGVGPFDTINVQEYALPLTKAIIKHENGFNPYDQATIEQGVSLGWA